MHFRRPDLPDDDRIGRLRKDLHDQAARTHPRRLWKEFIQESRVWLQKRRRAGRHDPLLAWGRFVQYNGAKLFRHRT
jgi:hypothetical protein